jgi:hypothetical protein
MANQFKESEFGGGYGSTGVDVDANGDISMDGNLIVGGTLTAGGANAILGTVGATTNRLVRSDGTGTKTVKATGITVDDSNNVSGVGTLGCGAITSSGAIGMAGALSGVTSLSMNGDLTIAGTNRQVIGTGGGSLSLVHTRAGLSIVDLTPNPSDGTSEALWRHGRSTTTSGARSSVWYRGDGSSTPAMNLNHATGDITLTGAVSVTGISTSGGTGATGALADRTYTPTGTAVTNCDGTSNGSASWSRVGKTVKVEGVITIDPTAAGACVVRVTLPVASDFTASTDLHGNGGNVNGQIANIAADATNDQAQFTVTAPSGTAFPIYFSFTYQVK